MPSNVVPTLSTDGWVDSPTVKADRLFSHFLMSEYSQTALYATNVASMPYIIQKNKEAPLSTAQDLKNTLTIYFERYYDEVSVETSWVEVEPNSAKAEIQIFISLMDSDGVRFSLGKAITTIDSVVQKVMDLNN